MATTFHWSGKTRKGTIESGEMVAVTKEEVIRELRKKNIIPTAITEKKKKSLFAFKRKINDKDIVVFTRQFSTMINAGVPLVQALGTLSTQVENKTLGEVLTQVKADVERGLTYTDALKNHPRVFSELYVNMVAAGETSGALDTILNRLAAYIEKVMKTKKKVKGALIYPSVVTTVAILVIAIIMVFVVPTFSKMFAALGGTLPLLTRIVISISNFLAGIGGLLVFGSIIAVAVFITQLRRTERGKKTIDAVLLKLPIFGVLLKKVALAKLSRTLGTLIGSGIPILDGLEIAAKTSGNKVIEYAVMEVRNEVVRGKTLVEPITKAKVFPPMATHMIAVGESTGTLESMLGKIADFYDDEVDVAVSNLTTTIEPILIVFLGATIGFIVISMYLPIFRLMALIR